MKLHIIAAIVDTKELTLYMKDGTSKKIPQGNPLLSKVLEEITPQMIQNKEAFYDFVEQESEENSDYVEFEGRTNGVVKFYRILKNKLSEFLATAETKEESGVPLVAPVSLNGENVRMENAINEIISNAVPMVGHKLEETETVVAVVGNNSVISEVESLQNQINDSNKTQSIGLENFMRRIAAVASKRRHSVEDLMKFMKRGDLPIADDGSIIIYKILTKKSLQGHDYVDCHTNNVPQSVGSYVCMDESLVDHNRNNECSNGLHVARRAYINNFSGDVCVLAKVAPEDVIAVPSYDANKMRVCGYHIIFELPHDSYMKLKRNTSMTDDAIGQTLLGKAIAGDHVGKLVEVRITKHMGGEVKITPLMDETAAAESITANVVTSVDSKATSIELDKPKPIEVPKAATVTPKDVIKDVSTTKDTLKNLPTRADKAKHLYDAYKAAKGDAKKNALKELEVFKKSCRCSWTTLGLPEMEVTAEKKQVTKQKAEVKAKEKAPVTRAEKAQAMMKNIRKALRSEKPELAKELYQFKQTCKCGWEALGLTKQDEATITKLKAL